MRHPVMTKLGLWIFVGGAVLGGIGNGAVKADSLPYPTVKPSPYSTQTAQPYVKSVKTNYHTYQSRTNAFYEGKLIHTKPSSNYGLSSSQPLTLRASGLQVETSYVTYNGQTLSQVESTYKAREIQKGKSYIDTQKTNFLQTNPVAKKVTQTISTVQQVQQAVSPVN